MEFIIKQTFQLLPLSSKNLHQQSHTLVVFILMLYENVMCHKAGNIAEFMGVYGWEELPHLHQSPDVSPNNLSFSKVE
jgi:hypothetical protein